MPAIIISTDFTFVLISGRWAARKRDAFDLRTSGSKGGRVDIIESTIPSASNDAEYRVCSFAP